jgi:hypothetical protein
MAVVEEHFRPYWLEAAGQHCPDRRDVSRRHLHEKKLVGRDEMPRGGNQRAT